MKKIPFLGNIQLSQKSFNSLCSSFWQAYQWSEQIEVPVLEDVYMMFVCLLEKYKSNVFLSVTAVAKGKTNPLI
jgi:hypothetical protein